MTDLRELIERDHHHLIESKVWRATIASSPASFDEEVEIIIPDFDQSKRWGPCRWQSRNNVDMPARGDEALAIQDNLRRWWVIAWWPF
jgi:hypothetical protein